MIVDVRQQSTVGDDRPVVVFEDELERLYRLHYRDLLGLASVYVDDRESAEEVVQDAFVKMLSGRRRPQQGKEVGYLRVAVLNGARSALRRRRVRRLHRPDKPELAPAAEVGGVAATEQARVIAALRSLPAKQASVLVLRYFHDLSEAEIADALNIARGSVKSHAHRGLKKLAAELGVAE